MRETTTSRRRRTRLQLATATSENTTLRRCSARRLFVVAVAHDYFKAGLAREYILVAYDAGEIYFDTLVACENYSAVENQRCR